MPASKRGRPRGPAKSLADLKRLRQEANKAAADRAAASVATARPKPEAKPVLSPDDILLFRRSMRNVARIKNTGRVVLAPPAEAPTELLRQRRERALGHSSGPLASVSDAFSPGPLDADDTRFLRSGHGPDLIKGLKRGKWPVGATLDLHGNTLDEARERLDGFLQSCLAHQIKCVRIVHGKGYGSRDGQPVLKQTLRRWLTQISAVMAYVETGEDDGGAGAVDVLLRLPEQTP